MHPAPDTRFRAAFDGSYRFRKGDTLLRYPDAEPRLAVATERLDKLQRKLAADNRYSLLLVFQAMDAAGKDGTIRAVMRGVDPAGCHVTAFKQPSAEELDHDFLWRVARALPERGRIGIFNRSHYEEVLVVQVHPEFLAAQRLPPRRKVFEERYESIREFERHLYRNGTILVKFWLAVSREEQRRRFVERMEEPQKWWKFRPGDVEERKHWRDYQRAYVRAVRETSRPWAPWYVVPADDKATMRTIVAETIVETLAALPLEWPAPFSDGEMAQMRRELEAE